MSVKRGVEVGVTLMPFFKFSFNPNSDLSKFASAVYRYNTFRYIENKENNKKRCAGAHFSYHPKQSRHISVKPIEYFFSNSTLISAIKSRSKSSQWKIKPKLTAELMYRSIPKQPICFELVLDHNSLGNLRIYFCTPSFLKHI